MTKIENASLQRGGKADNFNEDYTRINRKDFELVSGWGQKHSDKIKPYSSLNLIGIRKLVDEPQRVAKSNAQWIIPSTLPSRIFKKQEEQGEYWLLWADIDENKSFDSLVEILRSLLAECDFESYTTSGATEQNQKARVLIPLSQPLSFLDWKLYQSVFNDKLKVHGIVPDRASERAAQLCYLPNRGEIYYKSSVRTGKHFDPLTQWANDIAVKRDAINEEANRLAIQIKVANERHVSLKLSNSPDLIGAFNQSYTVQEILLKVGYEQSGNTFRHPQSQSGSFSASVKNERSTYTIYTRSIVYRW